MQPLTNRRCYVATNNQHQVPGPAATVMPKGNNLPWFLLHWQQYRECNMQWNDNCVGRGDNGQLILHCVHVDSEKGCSTTRGRWFGSGLPAVERQTCCCSRREVKTAYFSLTAVLASSIIRSCDVTFLHTPLPHSHFSALHVTVI